MSGLLRSKILGWLALALVIYYIATDPTGAGHTGKTVFHAAEVAAHSLVAFLGAVSS